MSDESTWPTHPDGTNMTIGEMPKEDRERILAGARARWLARRDYVAPVTVAAIDSLIRKAVDA
jgi:hypothetical protein